MKDFEKMTKFELMEYVLLNVKRCPYNLNRAEYEEKGWNFDAFFNALVKKQASYYKKEELVMLASNIDNVSYGIHIH